MDKTSFCVAFGICLIASASFAAPRCERVLMLPNSVITLEIEGSIEERIGVRIQTAFFGQVSCPSIARNQQRLVQRHIADLSRNIELSEDRLIGFIASPWRTLSNSAGQKLSKQISAGRLTLTEGQVTRLGTLVVTNQVAAPTGQMIIRLLAKLPEPTAVPALASILKQSTGLPVQRAAARALGRFGSKKAHTALKSCADVVDRMLSARCERSLIRWATQQTSTSNVSGPSQTQP